MTYFIDTSRSQEKNCKNVLFQLAFPFYIRNNPTHISAMQRTIQPINKLKTYENRAPQTGDLKYG